MIGSIEIPANLLNTISILLAARNSVHTWWTGIMGCVLFGILFYSAKLYADVTLQIFFILTSVLGWWNWAYGHGGNQLPVRHSRPAMVLVLGAAGFAVTAGYGWLLSHFTDAYAPFLDSIILVFSVVGQLLLVKRHYETWWCWLLVNTIAVPLYSMRGLYVTAVLYLFFWGNAVVALIRWRRLLQKT